MQARRAIGGRESGAGPVAPGFDGRRHTVADTQEIERPQVNQCTTYERLHFLGPPIRFFKHLKISFSDSKNARVRNAPSLPYPSFLLRSSVGRALDVLGPRRSLSSQRRQTSAHEPGLEKLPRGSYTIGLGPAPCLQRNFACEGIDRKTG